MKLQKENAIDYLANSITNYFDLKEYKDIVQFALQDIDLSVDISSPKDKVDLDNYPYLVQPLKTLVIDDGIRRQVCIAFPQQMGKSMLQVICLLYNLAYNSLQCILVYPSIQLAVETANTKLVPLLRNIEQFRQDLQQPFAIRSDRIKLSNALAYFQGAGSKIVSRTCKLVLADEASIFQTPNNINNLNEMKKRTRAFNECLQVFVSTPRYTEDPFWRQWLGGSQGYYYLRCSKCGELSIRSCDIHNLQFETEYNQELKMYVCVRGTQRVICPKCRYQHTEQQRKEMVCNGGYLHLHSDKVRDYPTFQAGVLASLLNVHSWGNIADIQLASGKSATLQDYISFDNSIRGLPYQQREYDKQSESALEKHYFKHEQLKQEDIQAVIISADTQQIFSVYCVMVLTKQNNYYVIEIGRLRYMWLQDQERKIINAENKHNEKPPEVTLLDLMDKQYYGFKPLMLFVDMRGHRSDEVKNFAKVRKNILMYGGTNLKYEKWKLSDNIQKLFLCDARKFQAQLLFMLYYNQNKQANYLFLPENISEKDLQEIIAFQPDKEKRNGNLLQNWDPKDKVHDTFDAIKMGIAGFEIASKIYRKDKFAHGQARLLRKTIPQTKKVNKKKQVVSRPVFRNRY